MPPRAMPWLVAVMALSLVAAPGHAAPGVGKPARRCLATAAAAAARWVATRGAVLAKCRDAVSAGTLPADTDCATEARPAKRLARAERRLSAQVAKRCPADVVGSLRFGPGCEGATTGAELAACLQATHARATDDVLAALRLGAGSLAPPRRECEKRSSKATRGHLRTVMKALAACRNRAVRGKLAPRIACLDDATVTAKLAKKRRAAVGTIDAVCAEPLAAGLVAAPACRLRATTGAELAECLLAVAERAGAAASTVAYGDGRFCGDAHQHVDARVDALLAELTLEEKVAQMHGTGRLVGGAWATAGNARLGIPGLLMSDGPRGVGFLSCQCNATAFPVGMARGATWDPDLEARVGEAIAREVAGLGANVLLAPVTTVVRHPRWGRAQESYGEDPLHLGRMGVGFVRGAQRRLLASVKHYALNSIENTRFTVSANAGERTLRETYLPHFRAVVEQGGVASVMTAYNRVNGTYCAENVPLLRDVLKGDWGFRGFVESDWVAGTRSTVPSALAGLDIEMPASSFYGPPLVAAVEDGAVAESVVDDAVRRVLRTTLCFELDTHPAVPDPSVLEAPEHVALAREVAEKGIVLLRNDGGALPLDRATVVDLVVTGPLADVVNLGDTGSSNTVPSAAVTILAGIEAAAGPVTVTHVADPASAAGQATIAGADAVVVVAGFTADDEGEGLVGAGDRDDYELPAEQEELILDVASRSSRTIVVLEGGSAIGVDDWIDAVEALVMAWYPGMRGGDAVAAILFGDVTPSGKLPLVVAKRNDDLPPFVNDQAEVDYEGLHGYRRLDDAGVDPRFPFGFGLSYTSFVFDALALAETAVAADGVLRARVDVTNTGARAGDEVVQLYVAAPGVAVPRPPRDLRAFERVALAPGETRRVRFEVPVADLAYWDVAAGGWRVEAGDYEAAVGPSSRDLPLRVPFTVE